MNISKLIINILTHPVKTFNDELQNKSFIAIFILACLCGVSTVFDKASESGNILGIFILPTAIVISPLWALVYLYITSPLLWVSSKLLGGKSSLKGIQFAFTCASIPVIVSLLLWIPKVIIFGNRAFSNHIAYSNDTFLFFISIFISILDLIFVLWTLILFVIFYKITNSFSYFKSIISIIIFACILIISILTILWIVKVIN